MFSTANCSALIFLAVPLAELFFCFFCFFFFISIIAKEKASFFFSFDKAVYLIALPHQNLNAPPLCGKKIHDLCLFTYVDKDLLLLPQSAFSRKIL